MEKPKIFAVADDFSEIWIRFEENDFALVEDDSSAVCIEDGIEVGDHNFDDYDGKRCLQYIRTSDSDKSVFLIQIDLKNEEQFFVTLGEWSIDELRAM